MASRSRGDTFQRPANLSTEHRASPTGVPIAFFLAHAEDRQKSAPERRQHLEAHLMVGLAEVLAPLGVSHQNVPAPESLEHPVGNRPGVRTPVLPVEILCPQLDPRAAKDRADDRQGGVRDGQGNRDPEKSVQAPGNVGRQIGRLGGSREHLPVADDKWSAHRVSSNP